MQDHGVKVPEEEWRKIRRRGFMPKRVKAETHDRKPSRAEIKKILNYADIKCRSQVLFQVSSGTRVGETLQLKEADLKLDADPPEANIRSEYTKGGVGGRIVYFSYEARDAIKDWLKIKDETNRRNGQGSYKSDKVFPWDESTARFMWNMAAEKAGLDKRDNSTNRRVLHLHYLRKFFRSNIGLDTDITHALMGHTPYLDDAYLRLEQEGEIAKAYKEAMPNVSVYQVEDQQLRKQTSALEAENIDLKARIAKMELEKNDLAVRMQRTESKLSDLEKLIREKLGELS
jgi:integrase